jgi:porin
MDNGAYPNTKRSNACVAALCVAIGATSAGAASARDGMNLTVEYTVDVVAAVSGSRHDQPVFLDNFDVSASFDMERLAGWRGVTVFAHGLNNAGAAPNDNLGTLQGVDNIEVSRRRARLYELWIDASIGETAVRAGLYDLNSEFYANDAAALLMAPAFGIGSELAATGPNGPSIFPSTALAVRLARPLSPSQTLRIAVLNANAGVLGDPGGVDFEFDHGALLIAEWSRVGSTRLSVGAWGYTSRQDDIRDVDSADSSRRRRAHGAYLTLERDIYDGSTVFARLGISDGDTTPYQGGWQAGLSFDNPLELLRGSRASFGLYQGQFGDKQRANTRDAGIRAAPAETGIEFTYAAPVSRWLSIQPDLQVVLDPAGDRDRTDTWIASLRFTLTPFAAPDDLRT